MWRENKTIAAAVIAISILFYIPFSSAITLNPIEYNIQDTEFNKDYKVIITLINPDSVPYDINANIVQESIYLKDYVTIEPFFVHLEPNEKKNIQLTLNIPSNISPETHNLYIDFMTLNQRLGRFKMQFHVQGDQVNDISLKDISVVAEDTNTPVYITLDIENRGNVIAKPIPSIELYKDGSKIDNIGQESQITILPGKQSNYSLMYDPSSLEQGGFYSIKARLEYGDGMKTPTTEKVFSIKKTDTDESKKEVETINQGEMLDMSVDIINPTTKLSFYRIEYLIQNSEIKGYVEGDIKESTKQVDVEIDTSKLNEGRYDLQLKIYTGQKLEELEKKELTLVVESGNTTYLIIYAVLISMAAIAILLLFKSGIPQEAFERIIGKGALTTRHIESGIVDLKKDYIKIEKDFSKILEDINKFVENNNVWFDKTIGKERGSRFK